MCSLGDGLKVGGRGGSVFERKEGFAVEISSGDEQHDVSRQQRAEQLTIVGNAIAGPQLAGREVRVRHGAAGVVPLAELARGERRVTHVLRVRRCSLHLGPELGSGYCSTS